MRGWFKPTSSTAATQADAAQGRRVYYAGVEGLEVHGEPSSTSNVITTLSLHEKVVRSKVERGYAYVESATSGVKGWVDNADLIWRLPTAVEPGAPAAAPAAEEPPLESPAAPAVEEPQAPEAPAAIVTDTEPSQPTTTTVPAPSDGSGESPTGVSPSILDSY